MTNLRLLVKKSCTQLEGKYLDEDQANQIAKNIAFIACAMQAAPESAVVDPGKPSGKKSGAKRSRDEDAEVEASEEQPDDEDTGPRPRLWWLFRQLSYLARNQGGGYAVVKRKVIIDYSLY